MKQIKVKRLYEPTRESIESFMLIPIVNTTIVGEFATSSNSSLFTNHCYANEIGLHTNRSIFWNDDCQQRLIPPLTS